MSFPGAEPASEAHDALKSNLNNKLTLKTRKSLLQAVKDRFASLLGSSNLDEEEDNALAVDREQGHALSDSDDSTTPLRPGGSESAKPMSSNRESPTKASHHCDKRRRARPERHIDDLTSIETLKAHSRHGSVTKHIVNKIGSLGRRGGPSLKPSTPFREHGASAAEVHQPSLPIPIPNAAPPTLMVDLGPDYAMPPTFGQTPPVEYITRIPELIPIERRTSSSSRDSALELPKHKGSGGVSFCVGSSTDDNAAAQITLFDFDGTKEVETIEDSETGHDVAKPDVCMLVDRESLFTTTMGSNFDELASTRGKKSTRRTSSSPAALGDSMYQEGLRFASQTSTVHTLPSDMPELTRQTARLRRSKVDFDHLDGQVPACDDPSLSDSSVERPPSHASTSSGRSVTVGLYPHSPAQSADAENGTSATVILQAPCGPEVTSETPEHALHSCECDRPVPSDDTRVLLNGEYDHFKTQHILGDLSQRSQPEYYENDTEDSIDIEAMILASTCTRYVDESVVDGALWGPYSERDADRAVDNEISMAAENLIVEDTGSGERTAVVPAHSGSLDSWLQRDCPYPLRHDHGDSANYDFRRRCPSTVVPSPLRTQQRHSSADNCDFSVQHTGSIRPGEDGEGEPLRKIDDTFARDPRFDAWARRKIRSRSHLRRGLIELYNVASEEDAKDQRFIFEHLAVERPVAKAEYSAEENEPISAIAEGVKAAEQNRNMPYGIFTTPAQKVSEVAIEKDAEASRDEGEAGHSCYPSLSSTVEADTCGHVVEMTASMVPARFWTELEQGGPCSKAEDDMGSHQAAVGGLESPGHLEEFKMPTCSNKIDEQQPQRPRHSRGSDTSNHQEDVSSDLLEFKSPGGTNDARNGTPNSFDTQLPATIRDSSAGKGVLYAVLMNSSLPDSSLPDNMRRRWHQTCGDAPYWGSHSEGSDEKFSVGD